MTQLKYFFIGQCILLLTFPAYSDTKKEPMDFSSYQVTKLSSNQFQFVEGPAWDGSDNIYFTDIPNNAIHAYNLSEKTFTQIEKKSEGANGLLFNRENELLLCQQTSGKISRYDLSSKKTNVVIDGYDGKRFNRPNDLVLDKSGGLYFTDPSWSDDRPQAIKGVYYLGANGKLTRLIKDMDKPNGIILSPDEKTLYVVDSANYKIRHYKITKPGKLKMPRVFAELPSKNPKDPSNADGLAMDTKGNLYVSYRFGVSVYSSSGKYNGTIKLAENPSNLEFGGRAMNALFITAGTNLYKVQLPVTGLRFPQ